MLWRSRGRLIRAADCRIGGKSYARVCACLAIMKAGKGYLPLHVEWPAGRIADILQQAGVEQLWLTRAQSARVDIRTLSEAGYQLLVIEDMLDEATALPPCFGLPHVSAADVAYVIFTSGSTGRPKGHHRSPWRSEYAASGESTPLADR